MSATSTSPATASEFSGLSAWPSLEAVVQGPHDLPRWIGWRLKMLAIWVLVGCAVVFMTANWLISQPALPFVMRATPDGLVRIQSTDDRRLRSIEGRILTGIEWQSPDVHNPTPHRAVALDLLMLQKSARWIVDASQRQQYFDQHAQLEQLLADWRANGGLSVTLRFQSSPSQTVWVPARGWTGLSPLFWVLSLIALMVYAVGAVVMLAAPQWRNFAFMVMTLCHGVQLEWIALSTSVDLFEPARLLQWDAVIRSVADLTIAASVVVVAALHPRRVAGWRYYTALTGLALFALLLAWSQVPPAWSWWWLQGSCMALGVSALILMSVSYRQMAHPFTLVMRRFAAITLLTWGLLGLAIAVGTSRADMQVNLTTFGVMTWHVFAASQLLLSPYLSRSKLILQEFSLLAASSTVAASLDLLFVAIFSLGQITSMTLSLFLSFGIYLTIRRWLMTRLPGRDPLTMERLFQRLYRIARETERKPDALEGLLMQLMRELFEPLEVSLVHGHINSATLRGNGSVLLMPMPELVHPTGFGEPGHVLVLKHAKKGQRLFTGEDLRLTDRIVEQLHRALNFDRAVEQGRSEERLRIAQDLHDDIGARLLTLMYQAPNAEMEEYIRHTLQDLKTLTRGLAAQSHALTEAAGEWKRDLSQRLGAARCELEWHMRVDVDVVLNMVQWSALTRILRELVNNTISHAKANKVRVSIELENDRLTLCVVDNGNGSDPSTWSHGLGLGGVRKRVKQLGGVVRWLPNETRGIQCEVVIAPFSASAGHPAEAQTSH
ncbi:MAG TPA: ATP-binding protein [Aquabacterium sp.]|nr:ATP-binding protein [Aquabacterium sp.]